MAEPAKKTPVKIHLKTTIEQEDEKETIELALFGQYYQKGNNSYLKYEEVHEEGTVQTIVKMSEQQALILRNGAIKMRLPFQLEGTLNGSHESPFGTLLLTTRTNELAHHTYTDIPINGEFQISYQLMMQEQIAGNYTMSIQYKEEENSW
ncbi:uncharacterized beta-barrel protein YwiB (DUF1934 family) [Oikeobacillus pervagus]|uniref:Uncharacterized beta-barrel protein YwiB (DUF1934 family) n=1 Tax=Oikeobacillus pervagus TaxID=1325931 RepID=A0AAJ1SX13_9BACI|nr:DUF1934 family protein [Oikeobacillus pervagus]MDQ0214184.1 uncharacterized beta-barrel protein YwiB (DUF1934 family) [Oikeobacillus pervagus]